MAVPRVVTRSLENLFKQGASLSTCLRAISDICQVQGKYTEMADAMAKFVGWANTIKSLEEEEPDNDVPEAEDEEGNE